MKKRKSEAKEESPLLILLHEEKNNVHNMNDNWDVVMQRISNIHRKVKKMEEEMRGLEDLVRCNMDLMDEWHGELKSFQKNQKIPLSPSEESDEEDLK